MRRPLRRRTDLVVLLVAVLVLVGVLLYALHRTSAKKTTGAPAAWVTDTFQRPDGSLAGQNVAGRTYAIQFDHANTQLVIRNGRLVRGNPAHYGPKGAPVLIVPNPTEPGVVAERYVFTAGQTMNENVVVGACATAFGASSIQLAVYPDHWLLYYTLKVPPPGTGALVHELATGTFPHPLATDGRTVYQSAMRVDLPNSSVTVEYPGGSRTVTNPVIAQYWGKLMGIQIRHPQPTDGDVQILAIQDGPTSLQPFAAGPK